MMFYFREKELKKIKDFYQDSDKKAMSICGRRRVGKTELILAFLKTIGEKEYLYFQVNSQDYRNSLEAFKNDIQQKTGSDPVLASIVSFRDVFDYLPKIVTERFLIVVDEFPFLCKRNEDVMYEFQWIIDHGLNDMKLILLGSNLFFMKHQLNSVESPLYGRFDEMLEVLPFSFEEVQTLFPDHDDAMDVFSCTGGVAQYVMFFKNNRDVSGQRNLLFFDRNGRLFNEADNLLMQEFRDPTTYQLILQAIGSSVKDTVTISKFSGVDNRSVMAYLNKLLDLEIIEAVENSFSAKKKDLRFRISDLLFRFYYTFIYQNISLITAIGEESADFILRDNYSEYLGIVYEDIVRKSLYFYGFEGRIPFVPLKTGKWWGNVCENGKWSETEIDVIAYDKDNVIIGECKHRNKVVGMNELESLKRKSTFIPVEGRKIYYLLASKSGFTKEILDQNGLILIQNNVIIR